MNTRETLIAELIQPHGDLICLAKYRQGNLLWSVWEITPQEWEELSPFKIIVCFHLKLNKETKEE